MIINSLQNKNHVFIINILIILLIACKENQTKNPANNASARFESDQEWWKCPPLNKNKVYWQLPYDTSASFSNYFISPSTKLGDGFEFQDTNMVVEKFSNVCLINGKYYYLYDVQNIKSCIEDDNYFYYLRYADNKIYYLEPTYYKEKGCVQNEILLFDFNDTIGAERRISRLLTLYKSDTCEDRLKLEKKYFSEDFKDTIFVYGYTTQLFQCDGCRLFLKVFYGNTFKT